MIAKKLIVVEQYVSWNGHYKKYFENLISDNYQYLYCSNINNNYKNSTFIQASYDTNKNRSFVNFVKGRFGESFKSYSELIRQKSDVAHIIEFEPFSFLFLFIIQKRVSPSLIITVHSIERLLYANIFKDSVSYLQRKIYGYALKKTASSGSRFVTHYQHHKNQLVALLGEEYRDSIELIPYPCPQPKYNLRKKSQKSSRKFLIYGSIREDKGIFEFLSTPGTEKLEITIAGPIVDERVLTFKNHNINFINKYFQEDDADFIELINSHSFMLLPYLKTYTGGSGTLKDSIAFGLPVIASDIPTFREVIKEGKVGHIFDKIEEIESFSKNVSETEYIELSNNCLAYAEKYNWKYMRDKYFDIYENVLNH